MDAFVLALVARRLAGRWEAAQVQGVWQDWEQRLVLKLYRRGTTAWLLVSATPPGLGVGVLAARPACPPRPPALAAYLRAHAKGGVLSGATTEPGDRVLRLILERAGETTQVVLEALPRSPNLLVLDGDGRVRVSLRTPRGSERSGAASGTSAYQPPPPPSPQRDVAELGVLELLGEEPGRGGLAGSVRGFDRVLSRAARRVVAGSPAPERAWHDWLATLTGGDILYVYPDRLAAAPLLDREQPPQPSSDVLAAAGEYLLGAADAARRTADAGAGRRLAARQRQRLERRLQKIDADLARLGGSGRLRREADALAANLWRLEGGEKVLEVEPPDAPGERLQLELDPRLSPGRNLDRFYERVRKAQRARQVAEERLRATRSELAALEAEGPTAPAGARRKSGAPGRRDPYRRFTSSDGWPIWMGRNNVENDRLVREARPWDVWFHARDVPGAQVVVRKPGREAALPERTAVEAAGLAAAHSRAAAAGLVDVTVAEVGQLRKPRGAAPGRVLVVGGRTVRVPPGAGNPRPVGAGGGRRRA